MTAEELLTAQIQALQAEVRGQEIIIARAKTIVDSALDVLLAAGVEVRMEPLQSCLLFHDVQVVVDNNPFFTLLAALRSHKPGDTEECNPPAI